jgi:hypothetical protein
MSPNQEENDTSDRKWLSSIKDIVAIVGGITAVVVALLWAIGRSYVDGYYAGVNIPLFQANLTLWTMGRRVGHFYSLGF